MVKDRDFVNDIHSKIFEKYGADVGAIPFGRILAFNNNFNSSYTFKLSYIRFLKREKDIEACTKKTKFKKCLYCESCGETSPKLYKFKSKQICEKCLNPEYDNRYSVQNSSHFGHCDFKGM